jgi:hypothetical protein
MKEQAGSLTHAVSVFRLGAQTATADVVQAAAPKAQASAPVIGLARDRHARQVAQAAA